MPRVTVDCDIVRCAVEIIAEPGDTILVIGGVAVGVNPTGITSTTEARTGHVDAVTEATKRIAAASRPAERQISEITISKITSRQLTTSELTSRVVGVITKRGPLTTRDINSRLKLLDQADRNRVGGIVKKLVRDGHIAPVDQRRYPAYRIVEQSA